MPLEPKNPRIPERFLFFGQSGGGRSNAIVTWMREQPDVHFHIIDNEDAYNFLIYEDEEINADLIEKENFTIYIVNKNDYDGNLEALRAIKKKCEAGDVVVLDKYGPYMWDATQAEYSRQVFGDEFAAYAVQMRAELEQRREEAKKKDQHVPGNQPIFDQLRDWGTINTMHDEVIQLCVDINMMAKCHVVWVSDANDIRDNDKPAIRAMYKEVGEKPAGHKSCHAWPHTILHFLYDPLAGEYVLTTVKDRGSRRKKKLEGVVWGNDDKPEKSSFPGAYLGPVAGWRGARGKKKKEKKDAG